MIPNPRVTRPTLQGPGELPRSRGQARETATIIGSVAAETSAEDRLKAKGLDVTVPHSARIWNYWLGGKDNFSIDRTVGEQLKQAYPAIADLARTDRQFLGRVVRYLAGEAGIRQFLDIGSGLPAADNTHEVAQRTAPASRVVYVDSDPMVLIHAKALLTSSPQGASDYIEADFRDPDTLLAAAAVTLDFRRPVAVMLLGMLGHFGDDDEVAPIIRGVMEATAPGSYLVIAHGSSTSAGLRDAARRYDESGADPYTLRSPDQLARFFEGLDLVPPGLVPVPRWRPETAGGHEAAEGDVLSFCAVGRKPPGLPGECQRHRGGHGLVAGVIGSPERRSGTEAGARRRSPRTGGAGPGDTTAAPRCLRGRRGSAGCPGTPGPPNCAGRCAGTARRGHSGRAPRRDGPRSACSRPPRAAGGRHHAARTPGNPGPE